jgi:hypothetical protein
MNDPFPEELTPLKVSCTHSECEKGLHCFLATRKMKLEMTEGRCRSCGIELIDWTRIHQRNPSDAAFTFDSLKKEFIRHYFWHLPIDEEALAHARKKGAVALRADAHKRVRQALGKAKPFRDGTQTPFRGRAVYYAQHATATCCRKCVEEWHGIPRGQALTEAEIAYLAELIVLYFDERLADLPSEGERAARKQSIGTPNTTVPVSVVTAQ